VSGKGSATQVTEGGSGRFKIEVTGTRDEDAFRLTWSGPGGSLDVVMPIDGQTAEGTWEIEEGGTGTRARSRSSAGTATLEADPASRSPLHGCGAPEKHTPAVIKGKYL
jgi:hypothetical protein